VSRYLINSAFEEANIIVPAFAFKFIISLPLNTSSHSPDPLNTTAIHSIPAIRDRRGKSKPIQLHLLSLAYSHFALKLPQLISEWLAESQKSWPDSHYLKLNHKGIRSSYFKEY
jgi:hypothetical protein